MVKFRGISISIVSQFDIRTLPEYHPPLSPSPDPFTVSGPAVRSSQSIASCYVPIYPSSQIWFEYSVDGPHPENAAYFFKMLNNGQVITSWDCTAVNGYCGKTTYALEYTGTDEESGVSLVKRQAFSFAAGRGNENVDSKSKGRLEDYVEIRVHRIEHRQRIALDSEICSGITQGQVVDGSKGNAICFVNSGYLEQGCPKRRYRYQLLDPVDEPYATFRFYYRSYDFLQENNIIQYEPGDSCSSLFSCLNAQSVSSTVSTSSCKDRILTETETSPPQATCKILNPSTERSFDGDAEENLDAIVPASDLGTSLRLVIKDSIEELPSNVPRSPKSDMTTVLHKTRASTSDVPASPSPSKTSKPSPRKLQKKKLTLNLEGIEFDLDKKKRRPLSPFTGAGMLRRMMSPAPPSAPAAVTEFGPSIYDEIEEKWGNVEEETKEIEKVPVAGRQCERTTRADRGGKGLIGFLGRRIGRAV